MAIPARPEAGKLVRSAEASDVLDVIAAARTALRFATGRVGRLPEEPATDARGLRMEIVY
ncbi:MAG: hypothetical protein M3442_13745 [Chloroflexota bacterium]|nr:hypothetical protein [Chloroflexota bacterium]